MKCNYSKEILIDCLLSEFAQSDSDEFTFDGYQKHLSTLTLEQLIEETGCDDDESALDDFIYAFS